MPLFQDPAAFQKKLAGLPIMTCRAGEDVLSAGSKSGKLLFLKSGAVEVMKDGVQIAQVSAAGAVFGELAALLDQPHTADVRALEPSEFLVADAPTLSPSIRASLFTSPRSLRSVSTAPIAHCST